MTETKHVEIYKKYRPRKWSGLIGQEKAAKSLQAAVKANKLPTAYLFAGPRGTGKTSAALLLAKSLNCLDPQQGNNPCNKCEVCLAIDEGTQLGVNYISMANKGSADDVRQIVQEARLRQPVKKQVWILDEFHNLSKSAQDALLIPLEDPNMPSLFILCSTAIEKIAQTILSRVQQRRFNLVESEMLLKYIKKIGEVEKLELTESQYETAVRKGRGSVRDTLTALEAIVSTDEDLEESSSAKLLESISNHDISEALKAVSESSNAGEDPRDVSEALFSDLRDLLLISSGVDRSLVGIIPVADEQKTIKGFINRKVMNHVLEEVGLGITRMAAGADSRISLEIAIVNSINRLQEFKKRLESRKEQ